MTDCTYIPDSGIFLAAWAIIAFLVTLFLIAIDPTTRRKR